MKVFLDTNVVIDLIISRNPFYKDIAEIVKIAEKKEVKLYTSSLSFVNTFYVASKVNAKGLVIESLKKYRMNKAQEKNLPPNYIFNDITLNEIVAYKPTTIEELLSIKGFGPKKCDWYGEDILDIIRSL